MARVRSPQGQLLRHALAALVVSAVLSVTDSPLRADPLIIQLEGQAPQIHCSLAEKMSGVELWRLFKRSHVVFFDGAGYKCDSEEETLEKDSDEVANIPLPEEPEGGGTPWCYCRKEVEVQYLKNLKEQDTNLYNRFVVMGTGPSMIESWQPHNLPDGITPDMAANLYRHLGIADAPLTSQNQRLLDRFERSVFEELGTAPPGFSAQ